MCRYTLAANGWFVWEGNGCPGPGTEKKVYRNGLTAVAERQTTGRVDVFNNIEHQTPNSLRTLELQRNYGVLGT